MTDAQKEAQSEAVVKERQMHCTHSIIKHASYTVGRCVHCGVTQTEANELAELMISRMYAGMHGGNVP